MGRGIGDMLHFSARPRRDIEMVKRVCSEDIRFPIHHAFRIGLEVRPRCNRDTPLKLLNRPDLGETVFFPILRVLVVFHQRLQKRKLQLHRFHSLLADHLLKNRF